LFLEKSLWSLRLPSNNTTTTTACSCQVLYAYALPLYHHWNDDLPEVMAEFDESYECIEDVAQQDDYWSFTLQVAGNFSPDTRRYLFMNDLTSLRMLVESFPTHRLCEEYLSSTMKLLGKTVKVILYRNPQYDEKEFPLRFTPHNAQRLRLLRLLAVCAQYAGIDLTDDGDITDEKLGAFTQLSVLVTDPKIGTFSDALVPAVLLTGSLAINYTNWVDRFTEFMGSIRSKFTGVPLSYLLRTQDESGSSDITTYDSTDLFLIATISFDKAVNVGFQEENKILASCLVKAFGSGNSITNDLQKSLGKGLGREVWVKFKNTMIGSEVISSARIATLEYNLKATYSGSTKGQTIQMHNSKFSKIVHDLANLGTEMDDARQVRDYLQTIIDPAMIYTKDRVRSELATTYNTLEKIQQVFVDTIGGREADAVTLSHRPREVKAATKSTAKYTKGKGKGKNKGAVKKGDGKSKRGSLTDAEVATGKLNNPEDWFKTTKIIPPTHYHALSAEHKKIVGEWRKANNRAVKGLRTEPPSKRLKTAPVNSHNPYELPQGYEGYIYDHVASEAKGDIMIRPRVVPQPIVMVDEIMDEIFDGPMTPPYQMSPPTAPTPAPRAAGVDPQFKHLTAFLERERVRKLSDANETFAKNMAVPKVTATATISGTVTINPTVQFGRGAHPVKDAEMKE
jgi:hypothetical protein